LLEKLAKSLKKERKSRDKDFFKSFGAFGSEKSAEKIAKEKIHFNDSKTKENY